MKRDSATPGHVPGFLEPMKAKLVDSIPPGDWNYEIRFDGYRASNELSGKDWQVSSFRLERSVPLEICCSVWKLSSIFSSRGESTI
jgi:hypothetical protein